jgi:hypothetical protein
MRLALLASRARLQDIREDYQLLDMVLREAARQVASACAERGRLLIKVRARRQTAMARG